MRVARPERGVLVPSMHPRAELYPWVSAGVIAWGVLDCFFGFRVFKFTVTLLGGLVGAFLGQAASGALGLGHSGQIGGLLVGGVLGAGLAFLLYIAAVFVAGFGFGAALGLLILTQLGHMVALLGGCILGVAGGFLAVKLQRVVIILSTALLGSFRALLAATYFSSQIDWLFYCQQPQQLPALIESNPWMFPSVLALASVGAIAQFGLGGSGGEKKGRSKGE